MYIMTKTTPATPAALLLSSVDSLTRMAMNIIAIAWPAAPNMRGLRRPQESMKRMGMKVKTKKERPVQPPTIRESSRSR